MLNLNFARLRDKLGNGRTIIRFKKKKKEKERKPSTLFLYTMLHGEKLVTSARRKIKC